MTSRIGMTFHETFSLNRPALTSVIDVVCRQGGRLDLQSIRKHTTLGTRYVLAMPRYGIGCGIFAESRLTCFGETVAAMDLALATLTTQWLMHYHLSAPHGPGPWFWHHLVTRVLRVGQQITPRDLAKEIAETLPDHDGKQLRERTIRSAATVFVGSYAKAEGFNQLRLLQEVGKGRFVVTQPEPVPVWAFAYALADYWTHQWGDRVTVNLSDLFEPGGLSSIFFLDAPMVENLLVILRQENLIDLYRVAPPYQLVRKWGPDTPRSLLERAYAIY